MKISSSRDDSLNTESTTRIEAIKLKLESTSEPFPAPQNSRHIAREIQARVLQTRQVLMDENSNEMLRKIRGSTRTQYRKIMELVWKNRKRQIDAPSRASCRLEFEISICLETLDRVGFSNILHSCSNENNYENEIWRVYACVKSLLLKQDTHEGRALAHFVEEFSHSEDEPSMIRVWVAEMHKFICENRGAILLEMYKDVRHAQSKDATEQVHTSGSITPAPQGIPRPTEAGIAGVPTPGLSSEDRIEDNEPLPEQIVSSIAFVAVEEVVFNSLQLMIFSRLPAAHHKDRDLKVAEKFNKMTARSQEETDIPCTHQSRWHWRTAIETLAQVEHRTSSPTMRLLAIFRAAKQIYAEFEEEISMRHSEYLTARVRVAEVEVEGDGDGRAQVEGEGQAHGGEGQARGSSPPDSPPRTAISADEFLGIFVFVLCRSGLRMPFYTKDLLWHVCPDELLMGEVGYYLTTYESAVAYVGRLSL